MGLGKGISRLRGTISSTASGLKNNPKGFRKRFAQDAGMMAVDTVAQTTGAASVLGGITGKDVSDIVGYKQKTNIGKKFDRANDTVQSVNKMVAPAAAGIIGTAVGGPMAGKLASQAVTGAQDLYSSIDGRESDSLISPEGEELGQSVVNGIAGMVGGGGGGLPAMPFADGGVLPEGGDPKKTVGKAHARKILKSRDVVNSYQQKLVDTYGMRDVEKGATYTVKEAGAVAGYDDYLTNMRFLQKDHGIATGGEIEIDSLKQDGTQIDLALQNIGKRHFNYYGLKFPELKTSQAEGGRVEYADGGPLVQAGYQPVGTAPSHTNKDGTRSNEVSVGMNVDGKEMLLPSFWDGKKRSNDEALARYKKTGEHLGAFETVEDSERGAKLREFMNNDVHPYTNTENMRKYAEGGALTSFEGPGHADGGIPLGQGAEVEGGETKFNAEDYIFSDRLKVSRNLAKTLKLPPTWKGKTFAEVSEKIHQKYDPINKRNYDENTKNAIDRDLKALVAAQEYTKAVKEQKSETQQLEADGLPKELAYGGKVKYIDGGYEWNSVNPYDLPSVMDPTMPNVLANPNMLYGNSYNPTMPANLATVGMNPTNPTMPAHLAQRNQLYGNTTNPSMPAHLATAGMNPTNPSMPASLATTGMDPTNPTMPASLAQENKTMMPSMGPQEQAPVTPALADASRGVPPPSGVPSGGGGGQFDVAEAMGVVGDLTGAITSFANERAIRKAKPEPKDINMFDSKTELSTPQMDIRAQLGDVDEQISQARNKTSAYVNNSYTRAALDTAGGIQGGRAKAGIRAQGEFANAQLQQQSEAAMLAKENADLARRMQTTKWNDEAIGAWTGLLLDQRANTSNNVGAAARNAKKKADAAKYAKGE